MSTQIERNAAVVAELAGSDWQMAYVIACSVQIGAGNGRPSETSRTREVSGKVSAAEFARMVKTAAGGNVYGMGDKAIAARLRKWDEFREEQDWDIPASASLKPSDANNYPAFPPVPFAREDGAAGRDESNKGKVQDIKNNVKAVAAALDDPAFASKVADAASADAIINMDAVAAEQIESRRDPALSPDARDRAKTRDKIEQGRHKDAVIGSAPQIILKVAEINKALDEIERLAAGRITKADRATLVADFASVELRVPQVAHIVAGGSGDWDNALVALSEEK